MRTETARLIHNCVESQTELVATVERTREVMRSSSELLERVRKWKAGQMKSPEPKPGALLGGAGIAESNDRALT
jgi:hypothetical protein